MERLASAVSKLHAYCRTQGRGHQFENSRVGRTSGSGEVDQELYEYAPDSVMTVQFEAALPARRCTAARHTRDASNGCQGRTEGWPVTRPEVCRQTA